MVRAQVFVPSGDNASECVEWQRESFVHVLAKPRVSLLAQTVFGPHCLLDAVARVQARGHLDAAKSHIGTVSHLEWVNFHTKVFYTRLGWFMTYLMCKIDFCCHSSSDGSKEEMQLQPN